MAILSDASLTTEANVIKNETDAGDNTATRVGQMLLDLIDSKPNVSAIPKVYRAYLTQSGSGAPTALVFENTLGGTVVWTRNSAGNYTGTLASAFTVDKTFIPVPTRLVPISGSNLAEHYINWATVNTVTYITNYGAIGSAVATDTILLNDPIEIYVYV